MCADIAIHAEGVSKKYVLSHEVKHDTFRDAVRHGARHFLSRFRRRGPGTNEEFWALHDVSFKVNRGELVGVVGRNGAG